MDMNELYEKFYRIGREYTTMQGIDLEDEAGNKVIGIVDKISKENKIIIKIEKQIRQENAVQEMSIFDVKTDDDAIQCTEAALASVLPLTVKEKLKLRLQPVCDAISAGIRLENINEGKSVRPYIDGSSCSIRINIAKHGILDIWVATSCQPCKNTLIMTTDFTKVGITNAKDIVNILNRYFDGMNFMLDIDTNEN